MIAGHRRVLINQGEFYCSAQPVVISTVLGSCVAVCLYDPVAGCGGMNHFVLPQARRPDDGGEEGRCGDRSVARLVREVIAVGGTPGRLRAKLFGGAVPPWVSEESRLAVGVANVDIARRRLAEFDIPVVAERTGGGGGVRVYFETWSGNVRIRRIARHSAQPSPFPGGGR